MVTPLDNKENIDLMDNDISISELGNALEQTLEETRLASVTIDSPGPWWRRGTTHIHATLLTCISLLIVRSSLVDHTCNGYGRRPFTLVVLLVLRFAPLLVE